ncbi:MAG TPA: hypothetical protein VGN97_14915 [Mesorhizobium sp.]|nr:hypothetical protein [Mesorhizobium sp.]
MFRLMGALTLAVAVIFAVIDATRTLAAESLALTPFEQSFRDAAPESFEAFRTWVGAQAGEGVWTTLVLPILSLPGFVLFGLLALLFFALGRRRAEAPPLGFGRRRRV